MLNMDTLWVEDLFLADDLEARLPGCEVAKWIREAATHEEVEEIRGALLRLIDAAREHRP